MNPILIKVAINVGQKALCAAGLAAMKILQEKLAERQKKLEAESDEQPKGASEDDSVITVEAEVPKPQEEEHK